jgi:hypothetical protein
MFLVGKDIPDDIIGQRLDIAGVVYDVLQCPIIVLVNIKSVIGTR